MFKSLKNVIIAAAALIALTMSAVAEAKSSEPEPKGIEAGGFILHPGADVSVAYEARGTQENDDGYVDAGVHFKTRLANDVQNSWDNNIAVKWRQFWGLGKADPNGGIDVTVSSSADLLKQDFFRIAPSVLYSYLNDPEDDNLRKDFVNHHVRTGVDFYLQPSAGAVFSQKLGYQMIGHFYEKQTDVTHMQHKAESVTRWNFLPQTSMALTIDFRPVIYLDDKRIVNNGLSDENNKNSSSYPIRAKYSIQGLLLARLSYNLGLGYGYSYYDNGLSEHMFIMNAKLRYEFTENAGIFVEYRKDFDNVIYGDYMKYHKASLGLNALWFDHLQTDIEVGYTNFDFRSKVEARRTDNLISAQAKVYYHFIPGVKLGIEYRLRDNMSDITRAEYLKNLVSLNFSYEY